MLYTMVWVLYDGEKCEQKDQPKKKRKEKKKENMKISLHITKSALLRNWTIFVDLSWRNIYVQIKTVSTVQFESFVH